MNFEKLIHEPYSYLVDARLGVAAHDAGGANLIIALLRKYSLTPKKIYAAGPALQAFEAHYPDAFFSTSQPADYEFDVMLCGTGWQSTFEKKHMRQALIKGIRAIAVVDHWVNIHERFHYEGQVIPIHNFLVFDTRTADALKPIFGNPNIYLEKNPYIECTVFTIQQFAEMGVLDVDLYDLLVLCEPSRNGNYDEIDALEELVWEFGKNFGQKYRLRIRPHPSENPGKYSQLIAGVSRFADVSLSEGVSLAEDIYQSKIVAGFNTIALEISSLVGKPILSAVPKPFASELTHLKFASIEEL